MKKGKIKRKINGNIKENKRLIIFHYTSHFPSFTFNCYFPFEVKVFNRREKKSKTFEEIPLIAGFSDGHNFFYHDKS